MSETTVREYQLKTDTNLTPEERALKRTKERMDVMWHVATFAIINVALWFIDIGSGGGLDWAYWPTIGWGLGVAFHVASYVIDDSATESNTYKRFLAEERANDRSDQV